MGDEGDGNLSRRRRVVYTSPNGIIYNTNLIPKDKAPKNYTDLVDPQLSPTWAGKVAIPPYVAWLAELSLNWGKEKVKDFARKLVAISGGAYVTVKRNASSAVNFRSWRISATR
jgi:hypothetical protein